jgi:predicted nucleotide-binding protein (sugar kinase/HSP70/actin superfamily)
MKVTFPQLGSMHIFCKAIAETAGIPYVLPPPTSNKTREIGEYSTNESVCLPLKIILGNFVEALEAGADTIIMVGSGPPCRLGLYDRIQKIILEDMGYSFRWLTIPGIFNWQAFLQNHEETKILKKELSASNLARFPFALIMGWKKMIWCEHLEKAASQTRAVARFPREVDRLLEEGLEAIDSARGIRALSKAGKGALEAIHSVEKTGIPPLKVIMVGELYTVMEPSINMDIERRLGYLGVDVRRSAYFSTHIRRGSRVDRKMLKQRKELIRAAEPYLNFDVGAECNFSVAEAALAGRHGFDGVVHVYPFSCMPETNAATVLSAVGTDLGVPVLPMVIDRQDMDLRIDTQLEAYVDILKWRKEGRLQ